MTENQNPMANSHGCDDKTMVKCHGTLFQHCIFKVETLTNYGNLLYKLMTKKKSSDKMRVSNPRDIPVPRTKMGIVGIASRSTVVLTGSI